jgi:hypothetical protein
VEVQINIINGWRMPKGITMDQKRKGLLWIENYKRTHAGRIANDVIITEAKRADSDVYPLFDHDADAIMERYFHEHANYLCNCYRATYIEDNGTVTVIDAPNVIVGPIGGERYHVLPAAIREEDERQQVLNEVTDLLRSAQHRLARIQNSFIFAGRIMEAIGRILDQLQRKRRKAQ